MNKHLVFVNNRTGSRARGIRVSSVCIAVVFLFLLAGTAGLSRLILFTVSYGYAKMGLHGERCENERLMVKVDFLERFLLKETKKLDSIVAFEDMVRLTFGMNPISTDVRKAGVGGVPAFGERAEIHPQLKKSSTVQEWLLNLLRRAQLQNSTFGETGDHIQRLYGMWSQSPSIQPAEGHVTSGFGYRTDPITGENLFHEGMDIANQFGTPVYSSARGIVKSSSLMQDFGNAVIISHPESGIETVYGHLMKSAVKARQVVKRGDVIGYIGSSGKSTGPHLHYEIRKNGGAVNPRLYILPLEQIAD